MDRKTTYSLLLLAGGKSSRMGSDKAKLLYKGKTFADTLIGKVAELGIDKIYLSGYQLDGGQVEIIWDIYPDRGPLGGIHAGMKKINTPYCLVLPVDVPQIPLEALEELLKSHESKIAEVEGKELPMILQHGEWKEYLIGIYPIAMMSFIEDRIKERPASVHGMLESWGYECYCSAVEEWQVANINTLEEYQKLLEVK